MKTIVKFYRASSDKLDGLFNATERLINESLEAALPKEAALRSIQPVLYQMDGRYELVITLLIDVPDDMPRERIGFKIGQ